MNSHLERRWELSSWLKIYSANRGPSIKRKSCFHWGFLPLLAQRLWDLSSLYVSTLYLVKPSRKSCDLRTKNTLTMLIKCFPNKLLLDFYLILSVSIGYWTVRSTYRQYKRWTPVQGTDENNGWIGNRTRDLPHDKGLAPTL